jgi:hypothetical protein
VLYKVNAENPWTNTPEAIKTVAEQDRVQYLMQCPDVGEKGRTYGGFGLKLDPPLDVAQFPALEICFTKPHLDLMLEVIYNYTAADGNDYSNYFIVSTFGEVNAAPTTFSRPFAEAHEAEKPAPQTIKNLTVYGVVEGVRTPLECDFSVHWLRICKDVL